MEAHVCCFYKIKLIQSQTSGFFVCQYKLLIKVLKPFLDTQFSLMKVTSIAKLQNDPEDLYNMIHMNISLYAKFSEVMQ